MKNKEQRTKKERKGDSERKKKKKKAIFGTDKTIQFSVWLRRKWKCSRDHQRSARLD